jgi:hypothetical protein
LRIELVHITHCRHPAMALGNARAVGQAGAAVVAGACGDARQAVTHGGIVTPRTAGSRRFLQ